MNPLRKKIGIIGGGQLGRMMIEESLRLNVEINVLDAPDCPCSELAHQHVSGSLMDAHAIRKLAEICDVLTYEIEHVNTEVLHALEKEGKEIIPSPRILEIIKDKGLQKQFFTEQAIPTAAYELVESPEEWPAAVKQFTSPRLVAKTRKDGYDGKGVSIFNTADIIQNPKLIPFTAPSLIEDLIDCEKELSVMVARDRDGNASTWPVVEMEFDPVANLVTFLDCPATLTDELAVKARDLALQTVAALDGVGVFAVEMFLTKKGEILVNEVAPRPHNSGHHTIEACYTSQFEQLVRILIGLPLGSTGLIKPAVMMNLLGGDGFSGNFKLQGIDEAAKMEGVYIHLYGKKESKPMRKMGHITVLGNTLTEARSKASNLTQTVSIIADN
ncbi:MAG: 5-(carboxyamino)imidazole ribonucleotide synthase [Bacteroidia bacterium]|jgi:5-(carboxyamino)imidazole ribonucleotide synthase